MKHFLPSSLKMGARCSSAVRAFAHGAMGRGILHGVDPLGYFSFQPVLHNWCNKGYPVYNDNDDNNNNFSVCCLYSVPSQPPQGVQASTLGSQSIRVAWSPPPLYTLHGILQGYKILYKPVRLDEGKYYNVIMEYYKDTRYSTNLYSWMKVNIIMLSWNTTGIQDTLQTCMVG